jgi:hypothetical protein
MGLLLFFGSGGGSPSGYTVEIDWRQEGDGIFTIGTSRIGGGDVLEGLLLGSFSDADDDLSTLVESISIKRGRNSRDGLFDVGTCTVSCVDLDGILNPDNQDSPIAGVMRPMRPMRVRWWDSTGQQYPLFYGYVTRVEHDPAKGSQRSTIEAKDGLDILTGDNPVIAATGETTVSAAIGLVLDALDFPAGSRLLADDGSTIPDFSADGQSSGLALIEELLEVDLGEFFFDADGRAVYRDRHSRYRDPNAFSASVLDSAVATTSAIDISSVINRQSVTREGGEEQIAEDAGSIANYRVRAAQAITSPYLETDNQAASLANFIVSQYAEPRVYQAGFRQRGKMRGAAGDAFALRAFTDLGEAVLVDEQAAQMRSKRRFIEGIAHSVELGPIHTSEWVLSEPIISGRPFIIGTSALSGGDILTY